MNFIRPFILDDLSIPVDCSSVYTVQHPTKMMMPNNARLMPPSLKPPSILLHIVVGNNLGLMRHIPFNKWFGDDKFCSLIETNPVYYEELQRNLSSVVRMFYRQGRLDINNLQILEELINGKGFQLDYLTENNGLSEVFIDEYVMAFIHDQILDGTNSSSTHHFWLGSRLSHQTLPSQ